MASKLSNIEKETYFLIAKFLENGPCQETANALKKELQTNRILPERTDWLGNSHPRMLQDMEQLNGHICGNYLTELLSRLGPLLEKVIPTNIHSLNSVLTDGRFSLLRKSADYTKNKTTISEAVSYHGNPALPALKAKPSNLIHALSARSLNGTSCKRNITYGCNSFSKVSMHKRILGHLASVYCVLFDKTGHVIVTGADDNLVKLWSTFDGRLLATLRGHFGEISDLAINQENTLIAAGSCDKTIRIWNLHTTAPIAVLQGHTGMITSIEIFNVDWRSTPVKFNEKSRPGAQMLCSSFSPGGSFLVTGSSDSVIRVYQMMPAPPERIAELAAHSDHVDSIQFNHAGDKFASGSRDGSAMIWQFQRNEWKNISLNAYQQPKNSPNPIDEETLKALKLKVTMVGWNLNDSFLVTAITDHSLKVWDGITGDLVHVMVGHNDEMFVLECHPQEPYIFLSAGHDGNVIIWDLLKGVKIKSFFNLLEGQGHGAIFDSRFAPDGTRFAASDSHGHVCIFGFGSDRPYEQVPYEQFFHTDYRPLIRDANNYVLDEQTQTAPHLMPPPFLVDVDGNPHPPMYQLLIPGRNKTNLPMRRVEIPVADLPPLMAEMAAAEAASTGRPNMLSPERRRRSTHSPLRSPSVGGGGGGVGLRQAGDVEGVRQMNSNVFIMQDVSEADRSAWRTRRIIPKENLSINEQQVNCRLHQGREEIQRFFKEKKRRALSTSQRVSKYDNQDKAKGMPKKRGKGQRAAPRARITYTVPSEMIPRQPDDHDDDDDEELVDIENFFTSESDSDWNSDSSDTTDDSDWTDGRPAKEQREARRRRVRRVFSSEGEEEDDDEMRSEDGLNSKEDKPKSPGSKKENKGKTGKAKKSRPKKPTLEDREEYFALYRPPEWITSSQPQKSPYVPQIGDEVYYLRQGHELYVNAVLERKVYNINPKKQCYCKYDLKADELCRVMKIHYSTERPITCSLNLVLISPETGNNTGGSFTVRYHDMPGVLDFFVLRQHYDQAIRRNWSPGDRFRCAIENQWWSGTIIRQNPYQEEFPESHFKSLEVRWDTNEEEIMSPWDMEPVADNDVEAMDDGDVDSETSNIPVTDEDRKLFDYTPIPSDWLGEDRDTATQREEYRLFSALEQFSELPVAGAFAYPVDVDNYADYLTVVSYPTDLNTIRERLVNNFYRRRSALLWEIRLIEYNAKLYNEENSVISVNATLVTKVIASFICDPTRRDLIALYNETMENGGAILGDKTEVDSENEKKPMKMTKSSKMKKKRRNTSSHDDNSESAGLGTSTGQFWTTVARNVFDFLISREDSEPFRSPVDTDSYPDYTSVVKEPIDFSTIRQRLDDNIYDDPESFVHDVRLVFSNSRLYNTIPRSKIYGMTLRLSALFETKVQSLIESSTERRRRTKRSIKPKNKDESLENSNPKTWSKFSISNQRTMQSSDDQDNSLRFVLRRQDLPSTSVATRGESSEQGSTTASTSRRDSQLANDALPSGNSPRRTGIAINLRTGRARELSTDSSNTDSDRDSVQRNGSTSSSNANQSGMPGGKARSRPKRPLNMPRTWKHLKNASMSLVEPRTMPVVEPSEPTVNRSVTRPKRNAAKTRLFEDPTTPITTTASATHAGACYQTRSSRRISSLKSSKVDSEKENLRIENGIEENVGRQRRKKYAGKRHTDSEESENEEEGKSTDEEDDNEYSSNNDNEEDNEEEEINVVQSDHLEESSDESENNQTVSKRQLRTKGSSSNASKRDQKGRKKSQDNNSTSVNGRKRRRGSELDDSNPRKSRRTRLKVNYNENYEDEEVVHSDGDSLNEEDSSSENEEPSKIIGVSSRGRLRKAASRYLDYVDS
eukprot:gene318-948_t